MSFSLSSDIDHATHDISFFMSILCTFSVPTFTTLIFDLRMFQPANVLAFALASLHFADRIVSNIFCRFPFTVLNFGLRTFRSMNVLTFTFATSQTTLSLGFVPFTTLQVRRS
uniref:Uncharacterized protein n=1 Tax=Cucumis sativus TaxID=3659 RepID=A0A0A0KBE6_CUCSA